MRTPEILLVLDAYAPPGDVSLERFARPHALAEIQRRGLDVEAVLRRIRALMVELRKLTPEDLDWMGLTFDDQGLWRLAWHVEAGTDPLADLTFPAPGIRPGGDAAPSMERDTG